MKNRIPIHTTDTLRLVIMSLGKLTLACRIESLYKVVNCSQIHSSGTGYTGVTYIDNHAVVVIDLHQKLFNVPLPTKAGYFVVV